MIGSRQTLTQDYNTSIPSFNREQVFFVYKFVFLNNRLLPIQFELFILNDNSSFFRYKFSGILLQDFFTIKDVQANGCRGFNNSWRERTAELQSLFKISAAPW